MPGTDVVAAVPEEFSAEEAPGYVGRFQLLEALAGNASAGVFRAMDLTLGRQVALKIHRQPSGLQFEDDAEHLRVVDEARAAAIPNHPNIVQVFDVGQIDGYSYIAMELAELGTLADRAATGPAMSAEEICQYAADVADALAAAHEAGVVHGDVKPSNALLTRDGRCKLGDFGIASVRDRPQRARGGTNGFAAPELGNAERGWREPTVASDAYGFAATFLHVCSFFGDGGRAAMAEPGGLEFRLKAILGPMLHRDPSMRGQKMADVGRALHGLLSVEENPPVKKGGRSRRGAAIAVATLSCAAAIWALLALCDPEDMGFSALKANSPVARRPSTRAPTTLPTYTLSDSGELQRIARDFPGTPVRFRGTVVTCAVSENGQVCQVFFTPRDRPRPFFCAFFPEMYDAMKAKFGGEAGVLLAGRTVDVTGRLTMYHGVPEVILEDADSIRDLGAECSVPTKP